MFHIRISPANQIMLNQIKLNFIELNDGEIHCDKSYKSVSDTVSDKDK